MGGDLSVTTLICAYENGIFPWYNPGQPILWWSPDPRTVLTPDGMKISRSLRKTLRRQVFDVRIDSAFTRVIDACAESRANNDGGGTWITSEMRDAYVALHRDGFAHSVECWRDEVLAGGLYGVSLGGMFFGESMFSYQSDASKVALAYLCAQLQCWDFDLIDCQLHSNHLESLGAQPLPRDAFMKRLNASLHRRDQIGTWEFDSTCIARQLTF